MLEVLTKALSFILIIILGYVLKRYKVFAPDDYKLVAKVALNITMPAAVITSFGHFAMDYSLFAALLVGLAGNVLMVVISLLITKRETAAAKLFYIFSMAGYNIGCFTMPFVASFLGPMGVVAICIFDIGNSIMCTGGTYAFAASAIGDASGRREQITIRGIFDKLLRSVPFVVYMVMLAMALTEIKFPASVYTFTKIVADANTFLCMLMIGMMFELRLDSRSWGYVKEIIFWRYLTGISGAVAAYLYGPFTPELNRAIAAAFLAPSTALGPIFIEKLGGNVELAGVLNSLTIVISVILLSAFFVFTH